MGTIKISKKRINLGDARLEQATIKDYGETINVLGSVSGTTDIDLELGNVVTATISSATTFTFSNPPVSGIAGSFTLIVTNPSTNITWPSAVKWPAATEPTWTTTGTDVIAFFTQDAGTIWYGALSGADYAGVTPTYGYIGGGGASGVSLLTTERVTFSTGVFAANATSNLSTTRDGLGGISDTVTYGYFGGGESNGANQTTTDRITFATGVTAANATSNLLTARRYLTGLSDGSTYGYFAGGFITGNSAIVERITFSSGTTAANTSNLPQARYGVTGLSDGATYGYVGGGDTAGGGGPVDTTDRITFSTSAIAANTASNLKSARYFPSAVSDTSTYGYFAGGDSAGTKVKVADRLTFSTSVTAANTASNLSTDRHSPAGVGDSSTYGYFAGGNSGAYVLTTDRIVFSTGITSAATGSNLPTIRGFASSMGVSETSV
ncbi:MAG: hypothetical protein Q8Q18_01115 [bacterium]|nr:hypothetical protein [bacterium]